MPLKKLLKKNPKSFAELRGGLPPRSSVFKDEPDGSRAVRITLRLSLPNLFIDALKGKLFTLSEEQEIALRRKIVERLEEDFK